MPAPTVQLYTGRASRECGLCGATARYEVTGIGGRQYACKDRTHLAVIKQVVASDAGVEEDIEIDLSALRITTSLDLAPSKPEEPPMPAPTDTPILVLKRQVNRWHSAAARWQALGRPRKARACTKKAQEFEAALRELEPARFTVYDPARPMRRED